MAKYNVLKTFRDKETQVIYEADSTVELTVKRGDEVLAKLGNSFLKRVLEKKEEPDNTIDETPEAPKEDKGVK